MYKSHFMSCNYDIIADLKLKLLNKILESSLFLTYQKFLLNFGTQAINILFLYKFP